MSQLFFNYYWKMADQERIERLKCAPGVDARELWLERAKTEWMDI